ncbi:MAG TPA: hypothetical protein VGI39_16520 [Polyangiaceae bacterium]|jgi:hypothetical protein
MNGDDWLDALGRAARRQKQEKGEDEARWERLAEGKLSADEDAELRRLAAEDPEVAAKYEAYRPLGDDVKERIAARIGEALPAPEAKVAVLPRRSRAGVAFVAALAMAAGALVWMHRTADPGAMASLDDALPSYEMTVSGDRTTRAAGDAPAEAIVELHADSQVNLVLRPAKAIAGDIGVRGFLVQGGTAKAWAPPVQISKDGAVRISGAAGDIFGGPGEWDVALGVGRPSDLPDDPSIVAAEVAGAHHEHAFRLLVRKVRVVGAP